MANLKLREQLEELARLGSPVDLSVADRPSTPRKVEVQQVGDSCTAQLLRLPNKNVGYIAEVAITNLTSTPIELVELTLQAPWKDPFFQWLWPEKRIVKQPPRKSRTARSEYGYAFPGQTWIYDCKEVINHLLLEDGKLPAKRRIRGLLLAVGGPFPEDLRHGQRVDMRLVINIAGGADYAETISLFADSLFAEELSVREAAKPLRVPLFARRSPESPNERISAELELKSEQRTSDVPIVASKDF